MVTQWTRPGEIPSPAFVASMGVVVPTCWRHAEAVYRLDSLWRSREALRVEKPDTGSAEWLLLCADPMMPVLFSTTGPFAQCSVKRGHNFQRTNTGLAVTARPNVPGVIYE